MAKTSKRDLDRRNLLKGLAGSLLGGALAADHASAAAPTSTPTAAVGKTRRYKPNPHAAKQPIWQLQRPKPAMPNSYFWTWDRRCNWMRDDPGMIDYAADGVYLKQPETFVEDYRRLTDFSAGLGIKGITIWGFLRDCHGGIDAAKRVASYAASKGVAIMPGIGTNSYGGVYYEGNHPYNLDVFLKKYPDAKSVTGRYDMCVSCPSHSGFAEWIQEGIEWLFKEFEIGGANLENGDWGMCRCPRCEKLRAGVPKDEALYWQDRLLGYAPALEVLKPRLKDNLIVWATYQGFLPGDPPAGAKGLKRHGYLGAHRARIFDKLPREAIAQWNTGYMARPKPLPLVDYLDNGVPDAAVDARWTKDVKSPVSRNTSYPGIDRYTQQISRIKEDCLCSYRSGLEGVSIYGEGSAMLVTSALNYLAFSHFIHWPEDSIRQFGIKTLGQVLGSEDEGEAFAEYLAHWESASLTAAQKKDIHKRSAALQTQVRDEGTSLYRWRFWNWLSRMSRGAVESQTMTIG